MQDLQKFYESKVVVAHEDGFTVEPEQINQILFPFQRDITLWALRLGKAAIFADCGLGKSFMSIEWARMINEHTSRLDRDWETGSG